MDSSGTRGAGASNLREDPRLLRGVLASDNGVITYPEDRCVQCEREGVAQSVTCFHRHWQVADEPGVAETRG